MKNLWLSIWQRKEFKIILIVLLSLVILEVGLNGWARSALLKSLRNNSSEKVVIKAKIAWMSMFDLYYGRVDHVKLEAKNCVISGLELEELTLENHGFRYNLPHLLREQRLEILKLQATKIKAAISETALSNYLAVNYPQFQPVLKITLDKISLTGAINFLGKTVVVNLEGKMGLVGAKTFRFYPEQLWVDGQSVPGDFVKFIGNQIPLEFSIMSDLPLTITELSFRNGAIMLLLKEE